MACKARDPPEGRSFVAVCGILLDRAVSRTAKVFCFLGGSLAIKKREVELEIALVELADQMAMSRIL